MADQGPRSQPAVVEQAPDGYVFATCLRTGVAGQCYWWTDVDYALETALEWLTWRCCAHRHHHAKPEELP